IFRFHKSVIRNYVLLPILSTKQKNRLKQIKHFFTSGKIKKDNGCTLSEDQLFDRKRCKSIAQEAEISSVLSRFFSSWVDNNPTHAAKYFDIEMRHPFYDTRLVEFTLSLPVRFKYSQGDVKIILKEAMKGILPEKIRKRNDKVIFNQLIIDAINGIDLEEFWQKSYISDMKIVDRSEILNVVSTYNNDNRRDIGKLWRLINLEYWYRINFTEETVFDDSL
ncbi:MAG: hypothetical protein KAI79_18090, partial [Bacteroidales bacterium]|nr:hypothetical protein [Bacteroidales bacterium]